MSEEVKVVEDKARAQGWVPLDEWRGNEDDWKPAAEFVEVGENILAVAKERLETLEGKFETLQDDHKSLKTEHQKTLSSISDFKKYHEAVEERSYDRAIKELRKKQRDLVAAEEGETDLYDDLEDEIVDLKKQKAKAKPEGGNNDGKPPEGEDKVSPAFKPWLDANPWYKDDPDMARYADHMVPFVSEKNAGGSDDEFYKMLTKEVKARFPDKFKNPKRDREGGVEEGGANAGDNKGGKKRTYKDLPAEAKAACDRYVKEGFITKEQYIKDYEWED